MTLATQTLTLDLRPAYNTRGVVRCSQYDDVLRSVTFMIQNEGVDIDVSAYTVFIEGTKPDNTGFSYNVRDIGGTVQINQVTVPIQVQMCAIAGMVRAEVIFKNGSERVGSANFFIAVEAAGLDANVDISETEIPAYIDAAEQAAEVAQQAQQAAQQILDTSDQALLAAQQAELIAQGALDQAEETAESIPSDYTELSDDVDDLKKAFEQYEDIFTGNVDESVQNWLDVHPEATTTVDYTITTKVFDSVSRMIADTTLIVGDNVATLGYYSPNDGGKAVYKITSTEPSSHYETLTNNLYAELIYEDVLNIKCLGAKGNGIDDDTGVIQRAINKATKPTTIFFPVGSYAVTELSIPYTSGGISFCGVSPNWKHYDWTYASKIVPYNSNAEYLINVGNSSATLFDEMQFGFTVKNMMFFGKRTNVGLFNIVKASNVYFDHVIILGFYKRALSLEDVYDSLFNNVEIRECGYANTYPAVYLGGDSTYTNAIRFTNCRLEADDYALYCAVRYWQIVFTNTKFELVTTNQSPIKIYSIGQITFNGCIFTASTPDNALIEFIGADGRYNTAFTGCTFTSPNIGVNGAKWIKINGVMGVTVTGCVFDKPNAADALVLGSGTTFTGNTIYYTFDDPATPIDGIISMVDKCVVKNNVLIFSANNHNGYIFKITGEKNVVTDNEFNDAITTTMLYSPSCPDLNNIQTYTTYRATLTGSTIDANYTDNYLLSGTDIVVNNIVGGCIGREITIYANSNFTLDGSTNSSINFINLKKALSVPAGRTIVIKKIYSGQWIVTGYLQYNVA